MIDKQIFRIGNTSIYNRDALTLYNSWDSPQVIISDGGYGVSGFKGDPHYPSDLISWYEPHIKDWSQKATPGTILWFWNTEIGWALVHPVLDKYGWDYACCNIWNKGIQHIAGNCNLPILKNFPVVTEVCIQYVKRPAFIVADAELTLKEWLRYEWERTGMPFSKTNEACGVINAATRKYFTKDHLWYAPPPEVFEKLVLYANLYGNNNGKPYFSIDGKKPLSNTQYEKLFSQFHGKYGITNVWDHPPIHNGERVKLSGSSRYAHLNQKPMKLIKMLIEVSSSQDEVIWEPFGGLCTIGLAAYLLNRKSFSAEINPDIFKIALQRFERDSNGLFAESHTTIEQMTAYAGT